MCVVPPFTYRYCVRYGCSCTVKQNKETKEYHSVMAFVWHFYRFYLIGSPPSAPPIFLPYSLANWRAATTRSPHWPRPFCVYNLELSETSPSHRVHTSGKRSHSISSPASRSHGKCADGTTSAASPLRGKYRASSPVNRVASLRKRVVFVLLFS